MIRYGFNIKTKHGQRVENILIMAATHNDAERRLRQMYHHCEIVECHEHAVPRRVDTLDVEGVIGLISASAPPAFQPSFPSTVAQLRPQLGAQLGPQLRHKAGTQ